MSSAEGDIRHIPYVNFSAQFDGEREEILACVEQVFSGGDFIGGEAITEFEEKAAQLCGTAHAVAVGSGTDALIFALDALGIGPGDEVITPPNSFIASTCAIIAVGAKPVFADIGADQNIDPDAVVAAIGPKTKAIMPVHLTGRVADMDPILRLAEKHGLKVVEDAAQAIGSRYKDRPAGSFGDAGCFSTHPLKNLNAAGDGGFVATNNGKVAERIRLIRNLGLVDRNTVAIWGRVSRMDTLQAAFLNMRLGKLENVIARRRRNAQLYREMITTDGVFMPPCQEHEFNSFHTFVVQADRRDALQQYLADHGIMTGVHYPVPIHLQPVASDLGCKKGDFPETERQAGRVLSLPVHQFLDETDVARVAECINEFYAS